MKNGSHFENEICCKHLLLLYGYHGVVVNNIPNGTYPKLCAHKIYLAKGQINCVIHENLLC